MFRVLCCSSGPLVAEPLNLSPPIACILNQPCPLMRTMCGDVSDETYSAQTKVRSPPSFAKELRRNLLTDRVTLMSTLRNPFHTIDS